MAQFDLDPQALAAYAPTVAEPDDFDDFWAATLAAARSHPLALSLEPAATHLALVDVQDVTFAGFDGQPVRAWLTRPRDRGDDPAGPLPGVVTFNGYGGGRGLATDHLGWAAAGYAELFVDTRGQGSWWGHGGDTPDPVGSGPATPGFLTRGIMDPEQYYYRRLFTDAVRAVEALAAVPGVDPQRIAVGGVSQGGGMALAVAGLLGGSVAAVMADVPFLCHIERALTITDADPYHEVVTYLSVHRRRTAQVLRTLSYVDGVVFARRATAPARFSVALRDETCPPSTVYAAFNAYAGDDKLIDVYPFNRHEGGGGHQWALQLPWLADRLRPAG